MKNTINIMAKRAISPLIATIILVALTVAIGALIVNWGRAYVSKSMSCVTLSMSLYNPTKGTNYIDFKLFYTSENPTEFSDYTVKIYTTLGTEYLCKYNSGATSAPAGGCVFTVTPPSGTSKFVKDTEYSVRVYVDTATINIGSIYKVGMYSPACNREIETLTII
mgnify:CR=1 FL=1